MAMSAQQVQAELQRKKSLGIAPTNKANVTAYNALAPKPPVTGVAASSAKPSNVPMPPLNTTEINRKAAAGIPLTNPTAASTAAYNAAKPKTPGMPPAPAPANPTPVSPVAAQPAPVSTPFSYDPNSDPVYLSALARAKTNAQGAEGDAMAELNKRGILDSTITGDRVGGIAADAVAQVDSNLLPQLAQQAYGRYSDDLNRKYQDEQLAIQQGQLTGTYISPEMKTQYDAALQAKQEYANAATPKARAAARQKADAARAQIVSMGGNPDLVGSNVTLEGARGNSGKFGVQTLEGQRTAYDMSADNPANQAQIISNKIDNLKLQNLPEQLKLELEQLKQQVSAGKIDVQTAEHNLKELTDPSSVTNKTKKLQLEMTQIDATAYSEESRLKLEQLRKTVAQIGKEPALTENEQAMQNIELEKARIELQNLKNGTPNKAVTAEDMRTYFDSMAQRDKDTNEITNPTDLESAILNSDLSDYDAYQMYLRYGLKWQGDIPKPGK